VQVGAQPSGPRQVIDPIPDNLVREPVEYLFADHVRQRALCRLLKTLTEGETAGRFGFAEVLVYLEVEQSNHMADEEEELFPRLRARFGKDTGLMGLLDDLEEEHERDALLGMQVTEGLRRLVEEPKSDLTDGVRASIKAFVSNVMAHLAIEDQRILPLARSCLNDEEMEHMGRAMARRRGIDYPA